MKKILAFAVVAIMTLSASAQNWYVGGSLGVGKVTVGTDDDKTSTTAISVIPEVGYNFNENWAAGTSIGVTHTSNDGVKYTAFEIAPYVRYTYFRASIVSLFVDGGVGFSTGKAKYGDVSSESTTTFEVGFKPGVALTINENFGFVAHVGFLGYKGANDAAKSVGRPESWGLNLDGNDLSIGFYYNF